MDEFDRTERTVHFSGVGKMGEGTLVMTVFDSDKAPKIYDLGLFGSTEISFGRNPENNIVISSKIVSKKHGNIVKRGNEWFIVDSGSTNGLIYNSCMISQKRIYDGDIIRIDDDVETIREGVLLLFSYDTNASWSKADWEGKSQIVIGRDSDCDIVLPQVSVSRKHAIITRMGDKFYLKDNGSTNGILVNGFRATEQQLHEKDVMNITNTRIIFTSQAVYYSLSNFGMTVDAMDVVIERKNGRKRFITCNHVDLNICPGELVAIIGGSGAGKSTVMNAMCGYLPPSAGNVYINGADLYKGMDSLKKIIGYVPQQDIVFDNLTLYDMLQYTAKLRLPQDTSPEEREAAITKAIDIVELGEKRDSMIKSLSGGQRKRASIAVELLCDPNLIFLDEPASGLDPSTERSLMQALRKMADSGKTVILVTHSTLQLKLCDKIVFMGKGGNLCFFGSFDEALGFFGVDDIVDIYAMITENSKGWSQKFKEEREIVRKKEAKEQPAKKKTENGLMQFKVMVARNLKLFLNDKQRLILLMAQAPLLSAMISIVADGNQFIRFHSTQNLLFALSCAAFWIGMLNSIQEICKERIILRREYKTGVSLTSYILSKVVTLGIVCFIQSLMVTGVFALMIGVGEESIIFSPIVEMFITTFLTALAAAGMGLFVSSLFSNADRAMTVAPILLLPQILFSGLIFELSGSAKPISWLTICRWSMEGYGSSADLNELEYASPKDMFDAAPGHLVEAWAILLLFVVVFVVLSRIVLGSIAKEKS